MAETFGLDASVVGHGTESEIYNKLRSMPTEGVFHLDGKPGFGLEISTDLLDAYTVDRVIVKTSD